ncbi:MAG: LacI family DNA-binding transcriptional regulator [Salana multivorans]|uniref:LacI family DNA-binding transcriptional regulator n=1 Tax=Salana multivorans TaxID=120377 RepID=UPI0009601283|nr:LacI family DNA-binding transcriptional regulator [Salana multivorans]MBN8882027.1 LacI family DNA-binding transcriptional regulator [Salana multivorans]OJX95956.1 MAG: hypothetical protein BGO96_06495 [Micrococcales bacterium 73-15]
MGVTMRDVARAAGVSPMTVSNVLNGRPSVSPSLREQVLRVVDELGYELSLNARQLRVGRSGMVVAVAPRISDPYFGWLASALAAGFHRAGLHLVVEEAVSTSRGELGALSGARLRRYDGVVISAVDLDFAVMERMSVDVPVVFLAEHAVPQRFDHIQMPNEAGSRMAVAELFDTGARRVMMLGGSRAPSTHGMAEARTAGWEQAHADAGAPVDDGLVVPLVTYDPLEACAAVVRHVGADPSIDAVFAATDTAAIGALRAAHQLGLRVPEDLQVIGFDNLKIDESLAPALSSIDPGVPWIVDNAVRILSERIEDPDSAQRPEHLVAPPTLVRRESTRRPAPGPRGQATSSAPAVSSASAEPIGRRAQARSSSTVA